MDPSIARKREKKRRAPAPPNPFTGEVDAHDDSEADGASSLQEDEVFLAH